MAKNEGTGRFVWHELNTPDPAKARAFYGELLGWKFEEMDLGPMGKYTTVLAGGEQVAGIAPQAPGDEAPPHWLTYLSVPDVDAAAQRVPLLGGKILVPPTDIPEVGRFSLAVDPSGASFALYKSAH